MDGWMGSSRIVIDRPVVVVLIGAIDIDDDPCGHAAMGWHPAGIHRAIRPGVFLSRVRSSRACSIRVVVRRCVRAQLAWVWSTGRG